MNGEIYSMRRNKADLEAANNELPTLIYELEKIGIRLLYKTELDYSPKKLLSALEQTMESDDNIKIIFIINGLTKSDNNPSVMFYEKICDYIDTKDYQKYYLNQNNDDNDENSNSSDEASDEQNTKKRKKRKKTSLLLYSLGDMGNGFEACFAEYNNIKIISLPRTENTGKSLTDMALLAVSRLSNPSLIPESEDNPFTPNGYPYYKYEKIRNSFLGWKTYIPIKGDKPLEVVRKVIFLASFITIIVTSVMFVNSFFIEPAKVQENFDKIKNLYNNLDVTDIDDIKIENPEIEGGEPDSDTLSEFKNIVTINKDFSGWIYIPNTTYIDYPVMYRKSDSKDNYFYLYRDFTGAYSAYGSIFIDYRSTSGPDSKNVILHGHHMDNGMMFGEIMNYSSLDFYKSAPVIEYSSLNQKNKWKIISVFKVDTDDNVFFNYLRGQFGSESEFMNYVYQIKARSLINTPVTVNENDQLLTLSTCSYEFGKDFRTVVVARKVRPGESASVKTSNATYNPNPLWPDVYYKVNGGKKPKITTFENEMKKNKGISWYDGDGYLDGVSVDPSIFYIVNTDSDKDTDKNNTSSSNTSSNNSSNTTSGNSSSNTSSGGSNSNIGNINSDNNGYETPSYDNPNDSPSDSDTDIEINTDSDSESDEPASSDVDSGIDSDISSDSSSESSDTPSEDSSSALESTDPAQNVSVPDTTEPIPDEEPVNSTSAED